MELIVAMTKNGGIGMEGRIPWYISEELGLFRSKTMDKILVMGRVTVQSLPRLNGRKIICVTRTPKNWIHNSWPNQPIRYIQDLQEIISEKADIIIAGGAQIYHDALMIDNFVQKIHISIIHSDYECDTFFDQSLLRNFVISKETNYDKFTHYELIRTHNGEQQYLDLLRRVLTVGKSRSTRNGDTVSLFKGDMTFDLRNGFPLLTTKKMFMRGVIEEFIMFVNGRTDTTELSDKKVRIWEGNTSEEFLATKQLPYAKGVMGPMYGWQWRYFGAPYAIDNDGKPITPSLGVGIDQLSNVVNLIKTDPTSRRILMTTYNPSCAEQGVLYPCHSITLQFYVDTEQLDMFCYNRSQDVGLGIPFNIASSALLLTIVAKLTDLIPRFLHITTGDTHVYSEHCEKIQEQLNRMPYQFPTLTIAAKLTSVDDLPALQCTDFVLDNYNCHPEIKLAMIA